MIERQYDARTPWNSTLDPPFPSSALAMIERQYDARTPRNSTLDPPSPSSTLTMIERQYDARTPRNSTLDPPSPSSTLTRPSSSSTLVDDRPLLAEEIGLEDGSPGAEPVCLPAGWIHTLPEVDQRWISKALFKWNSRGHPELGFNRVDKLWWFPPQVPLKTSSSPALENYFGHPLLLWMPRKLWQVKLTCPHPECNKELLSSAGLHQKIRQVVAVGKMYFVASESLACRRCKRTLISWSHDLVSQLDIGHRVQFPCILTSKLACDVEVASLMRQRGMVSSSIQIQRKLQERHDEVWMQKTVQYLQDCKASAVTWGRILPGPFEPVPAMPPVPKHQGLMQVYALDVLQRLDEIKTTITSRYGRILKMDSTTNGARKLAGKSYSTATWATNVVNEHGQVIMSVLTASSRSGLGPMVEGLINRYRMAGVAPPEVLYVDQDCCGNTPFRRMFEEWNHMTVLLDIWHFMRRFAAGCSTHSHQLFATFMTRLRGCILMCHPEDLKALCDAKRAELEAGGRNPSEADVLRSVSRSELALHCRRITRGIEETEARIHSLVQAFDGDAGRDSLGAPLINWARMSDIIKSQMKHVSCLQDRPGVKLYTQTGTIEKGGHRLPTYRCLRGSDSLESFKLHLNRFTAGTLQSDTIFQAFLLDGLTSWTDVTQHPIGYNYLLHHAVKSLSEEGQDQNTVPYVGPRKPTEELMGLEYLYQQTEGVLLDFKLGVRELESSEVSLDIPVGGAEPEDFTPPNFHRKRVPSPPSSTLSSLSVVPPPSLRVDLSSQPSISVHVSN
ncbi:hypothetical protein CgunFtcFv8_015082 [Champsocephalus gunnari]|uniref:DUF6729 domain-containing protein n=1 Tax=Champsocephalus gunnari TaxID=52237 RepID=A0AAN8E7Y0_CHAGU|nr:hypothetical protein CgunFtcFv8_015082 [Champsocephalus gunnari]